MYQLRSSGGRVESLPPDSKTLVIGRSSRAHITIEKPGVSRYQANLENEVDGWYLSALDTVNATAINDTVLEAGQRRKLVEGDRLQFNGSATYVFEKVPTSAFSSAFDTFPGELREFHHESKEQYGHLASAISLLDSKISAQFKQFRELQDNHEQLALVVARNHSVAKDAREMTAKSLHDLHTSFEHYKAKDTERFDGLTSLLWGIVQTVTFAGCMAGLVSFAAISADHRDKGAISAIVEEMGGPGGAIALVGSAAFGSTWLVNKAKRVRVKRKS